MVGMIDFTDVIPESVLRDAQDAAVKQVREETWKRISEDMLIAAYVPYAKGLTREDALALAMQRDAMAAADLERQFV